MGKKAEPGLKILSCKTLCNGGEPGALNRLLFVLGVGSRIQLQEFQGASKLSVLKHLWDTAEVVVECAGHKVGDSPATAGVVDQGEAGVETSEGVGLLSLHI